MYEFLDTYIYPKCFDANRVAVKLWRHTLMHQSEPHRLIQKDTNIEFGWNLGWSYSNHYLLVSNPNEKVLIIALLNLIADLRVGITKYLLDLACRTDLQSRFDSAAAGMNEELRLPNPLA